MEMVVRGKVEKSVVKNSFPVVLLLLSLFFCTASADTLFVADRGNNIDGEQDVEVFRVDPNLSINPIKTFKFTNESLYGSGPLNLTFDPVRQIVFVSFETKTQYDGTAGNYNTIALIDFNTLTHDANKDFTFGQAGADIGGLCYDAKRQRLYATRRSTNILYIIKWHPETLSLEFERTLFLPNIQYACTICIDGDMAYLSEFRYLSPQLYYDHIKQYDISQNWAYVRTIPNGKDIVGMAYDTQRQIFYGGAFHFQSGDIPNFYIVKHVMEPNAIITKETSTPGCFIDGDVDPATGYLYLTAFKTDSGLHSAVEIWDTSGWTSNPAEQIAPVSSFNNTSIIKGAAGILFVDHDPKEDEIFVTKTDGHDPNVPSQWVLPGDELTYTITIDPNSTSQNITVKDRLPAEVNFVEATLPTNEEDPNFVFDPNDIFDPNFVWPEPEEEPAAITGSYDEITHTYTWSLGTIDTPVTLTLTVQVNNKAEPLGMLVNHVTAESDIGFGYGYDETKVDNFGGNIIYVDQNAVGNNNGTSWENAYATLQKALKRASVGNEIWVAEGTYLPGDDAMDTFAVPADVLVYGGFAGWETSIDQRHIKDNPTILSGRIGWDARGNIIRSETVVTMGNNSLLDGFIVRDSGVETDIIGYGIYGKDIDFTLENCVVENNLYYGVYASKCNVLLNWCTVQNNGYDGIRHLGNSSKTIAVENCRIIENGRNGAYTLSSTPAIRNNQIGFNGADSSDIDLYYGLLLVYPQTGYDIRNNTVIYNVEEGIRADNSADITIYNCILWGNKDGPDKQLKGNIAAQYSCVWDPNNIHATPDANGNISCDPGFAYDDPNVVIYHLLATSPCVDRGSSEGIGMDEKDLDNENRIYNNIVDMGADEFYSCDNDPSDDDIYNPYDWNADGAVNMVEFNRFSRAWLSRDPADPMLSDPNETVGWDNKCNFVATGASQYIIDLVDLQAFLEDSPWLWVACWWHDIQEMLQQMSMFALSGVEGMMASVSPKTSQPVEAVSVMPVKIIPAAKTAPPAETVAVESIEAGREQVLSLLESVNVFIDAGGDDAEAWQEIKNLLEQSLVETEDTEIETAEF